MRSSRVGIDRTLARALGRRRGFLLKSLSARTPAVWAERNFVIRIGVSLVSIVSPYAQRADNLKKKR